MTKSATYSGLSLLNISTPNRTIISYEPTRNCSSSSCLFTRLTRLRRLGSSQSALYLLLHQVHSGNLAYADYRGGSSNMKGQTCRSVQILIHFRTTFGSSPETASSAHCLLAPRPAGWFRALFRPRLGGRTSDQAIEWNKHHLRPTQSSFKGSKCFCGHQRIRTGDFRKF